MTLWPGHTRNHFFFFWRRLRLLLSLHAAYIVNSLINGGNCPVDVGHSRKVFVERDSYPCVNVGLTRHQPTHHRPKDSPFAVLGDVIVFPEFQELGVPLHLIIEQISPRQENARHTRTSTHRCECDGEGRSPCSSTGAGCWTRAGRRRGWG